MKLGEYVARHPHLKLLLETAERCLSFTVNPWEVDVEIVPDLDIVSGAMCSSEGKTLLIFRDDPPDAETFLHELIHLAGKSEDEAFLLPSIIRLCADEGVAADVAALLKLTREQVEKVIEEETGLKGLEEWYAHKGIFCPNVVEIEEGEGWELKFKVVDEEAAVRLFLFDIALNSGWDPWSRSILVKLLIRYAGVKGPALKLLPLQDVIQLVDTTVSSFVNAGRREIPLKEIVETAYAQLGMRRTAEREDESLVLEVLTVYMRGSGHGWLLKDVKWSNGALLLVFEKQ